jgi:hypothetical protein
LSRKQHEPLGMGNKPNAADPLTDIEINKFYDDNLLDADNPHALQNTIYLNNNYHGYRMGNQSFSCFQVFSGNTVYMPRQGILFCQICFPLQ